MESQEYPVPEVDIFHECKTCGAVMNHYPAVNGRQSFWRCSNYKPGSVWGCNDGEPYFKAELIPKENWGNMKNPTEEITDIALFVMGIFVIVMLLVWVFRS